MRKLSVLLFLLAVPAAQAAAPTLYDFKVPSLAGKPVNLADYRGKVVLVVNTASKCGFTPQYAALEKLYESHPHREFVILGFPCNDFGGQEPGSSEEISQFCTANYGVKFPMFQKVSVKPGPGQAPVYRFLTASGHVPSWNFCKYLIDRQGHLANYWPSNVKPDDPALVDSVTKALASKAPAGR